MSAWLVETLIATSLLMAAVLALRPLVRSLFGAGAAYALWLVPALRLVLPPLDSSTQTLPVLGAVEIVRVATPAVSNTTPWLLAIWAVGAVGAALWHLVGYQVFLRRALRYAAPLGEAVFVSGAVAGPAAIGLLVPCILVPRDFADRFSAAERALAIAHERTHHARGDLWANAAALGMLCLHWFNPLAWVAHRAFRSDQELSCDAAVIGRAGAEQRAVYAAAMVKSAWGAAPPFTCPMSRSGNLLRRLKMVKTHKTSRWATTGGMMTVGAVALAGLTITATGAIAADPVVKKITIQRVAGQDGEEAAIDEATEGKCGPGNQTVFNVSDQVAGADGTRTTRVFMCSKDGAPVDRLGSLQKARAEMAGSGDLDADMRVKALAALDGAIAQVKAGN